MLIHIGGLTIGGRDRPLIITDFDDTGISYETSDVIIPNRAGSYLGRDRQSERTLTFTIRSGHGVKSLRAAQDLADELTRVWTESAAKNPGVPTEMVIETSPGRRRRVLGRCGKISAIDPDVRAMQGSVELIAEFRWTDPVAYEEFDETFSISVLPKSQGGLASPLVAPLKSAIWSGTGYRFVENRGNSAAGMAVTFYGPAANPTLRVNGKDVSVRKTLAWDESVTVDGRTGTVTNQDGTNYSRYLTARTRLDTLKLDPGSHEVAFTAQDSTQTARAEIHFSSAYNNY